jgi:protein-S-isoprenylcysteine O-methyltransferase Ste14
MTKWGVGPKFTLYSVLYCLPALGAAFYFDPLLKITWVPYPILAWIGILLIATGIPFYLFSLIPVMRAFNAGRLITGGVYGMCRHPVYAVWVVFFVPALALLFNSWLLLSAPLVMYFIAKSLVVQEDIYLEGTFGRAYLAYKEKVPAILPYGWLKKNI